MSTVLWIVSTSMSSSASVGGMGFVELDAIVIDTGIIDYFNQAPKNKLNQSKPGRLYTRSKYVVGVPEIGRAHV